MRDKYSLIQDLFIFQDQIYRYCISFAAEKEGRVYLTQELIHASSKKEAILKCKDKGYHFFPKESGYKRHVFHVIKV